MALADKSLGTPGLGRNPEVFVSVTERHNQEMLPLRLTVVCCKRKH